MDKAQYIFEKLGKDSSATRDFFAGVEPTGRWTFESAINNKENHKRHMGTAVAGGFIGSSVITPAVLSTMVKGPSASRQAGPGIKAKAHAVASEAFKPYKVLGQSLHARSKINKALKTKSKVSKKDFSVILDTLKNLSIKDLEKTKGPSEKGKVLWKNKRGDTIKSKTNFKDVIKETFTSARANPKILKSVRHGLNRGITLISSGILAAGAIGGVAAGAQYNSGLRARKMLVPGTTKKSKILETN